MLKAIRNIGGLRDNLLNNSIVIQGKTLLEIIVRKLEIKDISRAVELHLTAFPDFFLTFLGSSFLKLLYRFYITSDTGVALSGDHEKKIIGSIIGTTQPKGFYKRLARRHIFLFAWASLKPLIRRPSIFKRLMRALIYRGDFPLGFNGGALLASISVDPKYKKTGIGKELMRVFETEIWKRGSKFIYLVTDRDNNQVAQEFYEKLGWQIEKEFNTPEGRNMRRYWKWNPNTTQAPPRIPA